jgi:hypothetical protein
LQCRCTAAFLGPSGGKPPLGHSLHSIVWLPRSQQMSPVDALVGSVERANRGRSSARLDLCWIRGTVPHVLASKYSRGAERGRERERERERGAYSRYRADLLSVEQGPRVAVFPEMPRVCGWCCSLSLLNRRAKPHQKKWLNWNRREEKDQTETLLRHQHQPEKAPLGTSGPLTDTKGGGGP